MNTNDTQAEVCSSDGLCPAPIQDIVDRLRNKSGAWINGLYDDEAAAEIEHIRIQLREAQTKERERWERALKQTWQAIDPIRPAGQPGSYARGYDNGFAAALEVLRGNLKA